MFLQKAALRPVPVYAVVDARAMFALEEALETSGESLQEALDAGFRDLDRQQPTLAAYLSNEVSDRHDEVAQSLGYFLAVAVFLAFREAFPTRLGTVDDAALSAAMDALEADEELRADDPQNPIDSDDVVAMGQPLLLDFVQNHIRDAVEHSDTDANVDELDHVYRAVLVEVIALSHAVASPSGDVDPFGEVLA